MHPGKKSYADQTFFLFRTVCRNRTICRQLVLRTALLPSLPPGAFYSYAVLIAVLHPRPLSHADQDFLFHPANLHLADTEFLGDLGLRLILVDRICRHALSAPCAFRLRLCLPRLVASAAGKLSFLALSGHQGSYNYLGALGRHYGKR